MSDIIQLNCPACGSPDVREIHGVFVCQSCGSRFILQKEARSTERADEYRDKMLHAFTADDEEYARNDSDEEWIASGLRRLREQKRYTDRLLSLVPEDPYGWASRVSLDINNGLGTHDLVLRCVKDAKCALDYAEAHSPEDEAKDIAQYISGNFGIYKRGMLKLLRTQEEKDLLAYVLVKAEKALR